jgi:hypothetical protein
MRELVIRLQRQGLLPSPASATSQRAPSCLAQLLDYRSKQKQTWLQQRKEPAAATPPPVALQPAEKQHRQQHQVPQPKPPKQQMMPNLKIQAVDLDADDEVPLKLRKLSNSLKKPVQSKDMVKAKPAAKAQSDDVDDGDIKATFFPKPPKAQPLRPLPPPPPPPTSFPFGPSRPPTATRFQPGSKFVKPGHLSNLDSCPGPILSNFEAISMLVTLWMLQLILGLLPGCFSILHSIVIWLSPLPDIDKICNPQIIDITFGLSPWGHWPVCIFWGSGLAEKNNPALGLPCNSILDPFLCLENLLF